MSQYDQFRLADGDGEADFDVDGLEVQSRLLDQFLSSSPSTEAVGKNLRDKKMFFNNFSNILDISDVAPPK
jgi:hypothetical protein